MGLIMDAQQILLPCLLLFWLVRFPAAGVMPFTLQAGSIAIVLLTLAFVGLWMFPPWWMPYIYGVIFLIIVIRELARKRADDWLIWATGKLHSVVVLGACALAAYSSVLLADALQGRRLPDFGVVKITSPLSQGSYYVAHGGSTVTVNGHMRTLDPAVERYKQWRGQSLAIDIIKLNSLGFRANGLHPGDPREYETFGAPVVSPCDGSVLIAVDGFADMTIPNMDRANMTGNHIIVDCDGFFVVMAHFRKGSVMVSPGESISAGDPVAEMGNSGNSGEPHLHIHAQREVPDSAHLGGEPLGLVID